MQRISTATKAVDLFGPGKHGFKDGDLANGVAPTDLTAAWFNDVQEELLRVIEAAGLSPAPSTRDQLFSAIQSLNSGFNGVATFSVDAVLTAAHIGNLIRLTGTNARTFTLPALPDLAGPSVSFFNASTAALTVSRAGPDVIQVNASVQAAVVVLPGETLMLSGDGAGSWIAANGTATLSSSARFGALLSGTGFQRLPSGLIFQWCAGNTDANGVLSMTLPVTFPNVVLGGMANEAAPSGWTSSTATVWGFDFGASTNSSVVARVRQLTAGGTINAPVNISGRILVWGY
ncbi:MAG: hypothetical protein ACKVOT_14040 [Polaromonas sp.]